jgi:hypothetical protein
MSETARSGGGGTGGAGDRGRVEYPLLTASNYVSWSIRVQAIMEDHGVWEVVKPLARTTATARTAAEAEKATAKDKKARAHLLQCLPDDLLMQVASKKTGKEVWECLKVRFVGAERVRDARLQTLMAEFDGMTMKEDESLDQYAGKLTGMSVKYNNLGGTLDNAAMAKKLFDTVPERFLGVVAGVEQFYDLKTLAFEDAIGRLKAFEERMQRGAGGSGSKDGSRSDSGSTQLLLT